MFYHLLYFSVVAFRLRWFGWLVGWFYGVSTLFVPINTELSHFDKSFKQFSLFYV